MTRQEKIDYLAQSDFDYIQHTEGGLELLWTYLKRGFKGYDNFTDQELEVEYQQRRDLEED